MPLHDRVRQNEPLRIAFAIENWILTVWWDRSGDRWSDSWTGLFTVMLTPHLSNLFRCYYENIQNPNRLESVNKSTQSCWSQKQSRKSTWQILCWVSTQSMVIFIMHALCSIKCLTRMLLHGRPWFQLSFIMGSTLKHSICSKKCLNLVLDRTSSLFRLWFGPV